MGFLVVVTQSNWIGFSLLMMMALYQSTQVNYYTDIYINQFKGYMHMYVFIYIYMI